MKVIPFEPKTDEEMKFYELDWIARSYEEETLTIEISFKHPIYISPSMTQDKIEVLFLGDARLFRSEETNLSLDQFSRNITSKI